MQDSDYDTALTSAGVHVPRGMDYSKIGTQDSIFNTSSGLGTHKDQATANRFYSRFITDFYAIDIYRGSWLAAKIVDVQVHEALREWRKFTMPDDTGVSEKLLEAEKRFRVKDMVRQAATWAHVFGGAAILINVKGGGELHTELNVSAIKKDSLQWLSVLDKRRVIPTGNMQTANDPASKYYMRPETYMIGGTATGGTVVHRSRLIIFDGVDLPAEERIRNNYWGDSIYNRTHDAISNADIIQQAISSLVHKSNIDVWKIKDLQGNLEKKDGQSHITKRIEVNNMLASSVNAVVLDLDNEIIEKLQVNFSSLDKISQGAAQYAAGAADVPATRLLGASSEGLNSTGDGDMRNLYDKTKAYQTDYLAPKLEQLDRILAMSTLGHIPDDYGFEFIKLWQPTDKEQGEIDGLRAQVDGQYINMGVLTEQQIAQELLHRETYQALTPEDVEELGDVGASEGIDDPEFNPELTPAETEEDEE